VKYWSVITEGRHASMHEDTPAHRQSASLLQRNPVDMLPIVTVLGQRPHQVSCYACRDDGLLAAVSTVPDLLPLLQPAPAYSDPRMAYRIARVVGRASNGPRYASPGASITRRLCSLVTASLAGFAALLTES